MVDAATKHDREQRQRINELQLRVAKLEGMLRTVKKLYGLFSICSREINELLGDFSDPTSDYDDLRARLTSNDLSADCGYEISTSKNPADDLPESPSGTTVARELAT